MPAEIIPPSLFCKPADPHFYYLHHPTGITWVSLDLNEHLKTMHEWVNASYTKSFWQMDGSIGLLRACYQCILQNPHAHPFIGYLDNKMIAFFDVYSLHADELAQHLKAEPHDTGFHLLMAPNDGKNIPNLSTRIVQSFLEYYFSFDEARRMYAEPDSANERSIRLLNNCDFQYLRPIQMSYKIANLYCLYRDVWEHRPKCW